MSMNSGFDPEFWYVVNHKFHHLVYRSRDKNKAKDYAKRRNARLEQDLNEYTVISGFQLQSDGFSEAMKVPVGGL